MKTTLCFLARIFTASALMMLVTHGAAHAQPAQISGHVMDESQRVVVSASLSVLDTSRGVRRSATSNRDGLFVITGLPPGTYSIRVTSAGFRDAAYDSVHMAPGADVRLDVVLVPKGVSEEVQVTGRLLALDSRGGGNTTVLDPDLVNAVPTSGRTIQSLLALVPGVVTALPSPPGQFSANGQRGNANILQVDGVSANLAADPSGIGVRSGYNGTAPGVSATGGTNGIVSMDALQEIAVSTSAYAAEYGRAPGAQIQLVTKAGSDTWSGAAFTYRRDDALDSTNWFINRAGVPSPELSYNIFGGVLGGPIVKGSLFFFGAYEGQRLTRPRFVTGETPSLNLRQTAPAAIGRILAAYPLPTGSETRPGFARIESTFSDETRGDATSLRVDSQLTSNIRLFGRYNYAPSNAARRVTSSASTVNSHGVESRDITTITTGTTWVAASNTMIDVRANYSSLESILDAGIDEFGGGGSLPLADLRGSDDQMVSVFVLPGVVGNFLSSTFQGSRQKQWNVVGNISRSAGAHMLKAGVDYRLLTPDLLPAQQSISYSFNGLADLMAGVANSVSRTRRARGYPSFTNVSLFAQDDWLVTPALTIDLGLRWDFNPPPSARSGLLPTLATGVDSASGPSIAAPDTPLWKNDWTGFGPRVGLAYRMGSTQEPLVIRAGAGLYFDIGVGKGGEAFGGGYPYTMSVTDQRVPYPMTPERRLSPELETQPSGRITTAVFGFPEDLRLPQTYHWNVTAEKQFAARTSATISLVGSHGRRLIRAADYQYGTSNPLFSRIITQTNSGRSNYLALQVALRRRLSHGLLASAQYTISRARDNVSDDFFFVPPDTTVDANRDYSLSNVHIPHVFSAGVSYTLPGISSSGWLNAIVRDLSIDGLVIARSGRPFDVIMSRNLGFGSYNFRPDRVADVPLWIEDPAAPGGTRLNRAAFVVPTELRQGNFGRNQLRGSGLKQVDLAVSKRVNLVGRTKLQVRVEAFNVFNWVNFAPPVSALNSNDFGVPTALYADGLGNVNNNALDPVYQVGGPRTLQLSVRLSF